MAADWKQTKLGEVLGPKGYIRGPFGSALKRGELQTEGIPVYEQQHAIYGTREFRFFVDQEKYRELSRFTVQPNDLIISCSGTLGRVSIIREDDPVGIISQALLILRPDTRAIDPSFLFYILSSPAGFHSMVSVSTGSVQVNIAKRSIIEDIDVLLPPLQEQKAIAAILGALDDKIELNRRMNATLEAMARSLFQSWFVDFDPVRAKVEGRAPAGLDEPTAALFPAQFQDSELGEIPQGWRVTKFEDFIRRLPVGQKYDQKSVQPVGKVPVLDQGKTGIIGYHNDEAGVTASLNEPVAVFANHTCYMRLITHSFSAIQNVLPFIGLGVDTFWAFYATEGRLKFSEYKGHWPDFVIQKAPVPLGELTDVFGRMAKPLVSRVKNNEEESRVLATLRDTLLPKLLSGELAVSGVSL